MTPLKLETKAVTSSGSKLVCNSPDAVLCCAAVRTPVALHGQNSTQPGLPSAHCNGQECSKDSQTQWDWKQESCAGNSKTCSPFPAWWKAEWHKHRNKIEKIKQTKTGRRHKNIYLENLEILQEYPWLTSETASKITPHSKHRQRALQVQQATRWQSPSSARASGRSES